MRTGITKWIIVLATALGAASCGDAGGMSGITGPAGLGQAVGPDGVAAAADMTLAASTDSGLNRALAQLRAATARYHDLAAAEADGFVLVTECEQGEVATVYVKPERINGTLDPSEPEGLLYASGPSGPRLVGVELVLPLGYGGPEPPTFFGQTFQEEDEFGVWGLHVWIWQHNPLGMFAFANPNATC